MHAIVTREMTECSLHAVLVFSLPLYLALQLPQHSLLILLYKNCKVPFILCSDSSTLSRGVDQFFGWGGGGKSKGKKLIFRLRAKLFGSIFMLNLMVL